jgi:hypothetical protein
MADISFNPALVQKNLAGVDYPADKDTLIETAQQHNAPEEVIDWLDALPEREYTSPSDVMAELGDQETDSSSEYDAD